jgi:hypothetical protein
VDENKIHKLIRTERLDITEADGTLKLSLFNGVSIPGLIMEGEDILPEHRKNQGIAGILFFNTEGDECGGLSLSSSSDENGNYRSGLSMTFDQYKQDQIVQIFSMEQNGKRAYGLRIYDRPNMHIREMLKKRNEIEAITDDAKKKELYSELGKGHATRMLMGKFEDETVGIIIFDKDSKPRLKLIVDAEGNPKIEKLSPDGGSV